MKVFANIMKILAAIAALAGVIYLIACYGDKIVAWAKKFLSRNKSEFICCYEEPAEDEEAPEAEEVDFAG